MSEFADSGRYRGGALLGLLLVALLGGCVSRPAVDVTLIGLTPLEATLFEQRLRLDFRLQNRGEREIRATGIQIALDVNDRELARGVDGGAFVVPRLGDVRTSAVVSTSMLDVARQLLSLQQRESFNYRLSGRLYLDGWPRSWPFSHTGTLTREDLRRLTGIGAPAGPLRLE